MEKIKRASNGPVSKINSMIPKLRICALHITYARNDCGGFDGVRKESTRKSSYRRSYHRQLLSPSRQPAGSRFARMNAVNLRRSAIFTKFSTRSPCDKVASDLTTALRGSYAKVDARLRPYARIGYLGVE